MDLTAVLPELIGALKDADSTVRAWAAQDIGNIGAGAVTAVPQLLALLESGDEGAQQCVHRFARDRAACGLRTAGFAARPIGPKRGRSKVRCPRDREH